MRGTLFLPAICPSISACWRLRLYLQTERNVRRLPTGSKANEAFFKVADALIRSVRH